VAVTPDDDTAEADGTAGTTDQPEKPEEPEEKEASANVDDDTNAETETSGLEPSTTARSHRPWRRRARIGLVVAVYVGAFGIAGVLGWKLWEQHTLDNASQAARQTAIDYAEVLTSIDSNNLDQNFAEVLNGATGDFKDMYTKDSMQLRQLLIDNKATAQGVVIDSAIESESTDKVTVLLLVDQTVTNTARPDARSDSSRLKITMEKVDNRWLASKVELP
jgi:Mce-associated membrane protein